MPAKQPDLSDFKGGYTRRNFCRIPNQFIDFQMNRLTHAELLLFLFIQRRTADSGKSFDKISYTQFSEGVFSEDGRRLCSGTGLCRASIRKALNSLVERGAIFRHRCPGMTLASIYEINQGGLAAYQPDTAPTSLHHSSLVAAEPSTVELPATLPASALGSPVDPRPPYRENRPPYREQRPENHQSYREEYRRRTERLAASARKYGREV
jgi:hypothetical protein